jgi:hypothetical protein
MSVNAGRVLSPTRHCEDLIASQSDAVRDEATANGETRLLRRAA